MNFSKSDFWLAFIAGEAIALLALPVFKNLKVFNLFSIRDGYLFLWLVFLPLATAAGLYLIYRLAVFKWPVIFQIGKYGIIGWLNTFLFAGIINLLVWNSGVSKGYLVDVFSVIAFIFCTINSFFWNKFWTFRFNQGQNMKREYLKFFIVSGVMVLVNTGLMHLLINIIGAPAGLNPKAWINIAVAVTIPTAFLGNFLGYRIFVFRNKNIE